MTYSFPVVPRYAEIDQQGVVFNGHYLTWFDEAFTGFLDHAGVPYPELIASGHDVMVVHSELDYGSSVRWRDDARVEVTCERLGTTSFTLGFAVFRSADEVAVTGRNVYVAVSTADWSKAPVPATLREALEGRCGGLVETGVGTKNRERRAARKKARDRARGRGQAAPPTADPFEDLFGPPRVTPEMIAVTLADAASAHVRGDGEAIAECTALLLDLPPAQEETVDRGLELAVARAVDQLWTCGWLPLVLVEHARRSPRPTQVGVADDRLLPGLAARASAVDETLGEVFGGLTYRSISVTDAQGWQAGRAAAETASLGLDRDRLDA